MISSDSRFQNLKEYIPGKSIEEIAALYRLNPQNIIKLGSNENPFGFSPKAVEALKEHINAETSYKNNLALYPAALSEPLVAEIKKAYSEIGPAEVVVGNGMDNVLECLGRLLLSPGDKVIIHTPTFEYYEMITRWANAEPVFVKTEPNNNFAIDFEQILSQIDSKVKAVFICSPNNPTGTVAPWNSIKEVIEKAEKVNAYVFLDEAYADFAEQNYLSEVKNFSNLIVGRTFSKLYGLAALRIGWAAIPKQILSNYRKVQTPFSVNSFGLIAAINALQDQKFLQETTTLNKEGLQYLSKELIRLGFRVFPSQANFLAFEAGLKLENNADKLCKLLLERGIILRNASYFRDAPGGLIRMTVGKPAQNQQVIKALEEIIAS